MSGESVENWADTVMFISYANAICCLYLSFIKMNIKHIDIWLSQIDQGSILSQL